MDYIFQAHWPMGLCFNSSAYTEWNLWLTPIGLKSVTHPASFPIYFLVLESANLNTEAVWQLLPFFTHFPLLWLTLTTFAILRSNFQGSYRCQLFSKTSDHHPSLCKPNLHHRVKRENRQHAGGPSPTRIYGNHHQLVTLLTQFQTLLNRAFKAITYLWGLEDKKKHVGHSGYQFWKLLLSYLYYSIISLFYIHVSY